MCKSTSHEDPLADSPTRGVYRIIWLLAILSALGLWGANLFLGMLNQDEGWYLYGARLVAEGQMPYRDFAFTQGPVMLYVYALGNSLVSAFGVAGGRLLTVLFGVGGAVCAALLAKRMAGDADDKGKGAALLAFILIGVNVYQSYFTAVVKTYALAGFLLVLGFLCLTAVSGKRGAFMAFLSGVLLALSTGTRVSVAPAILIVFLVLLSTRRHAHSPIRPLALSSFALGAGLTLCAVFLPALLKAQDSFLFCVVRYHAGREGGGLMMKAGSLCRLAGAYFIPLALLLFCMTHKFFSRSSSSPALPFPPSPLISTGESGLRRTGARSPIRLALWLSVIAIALIHFLAPFPYDEYQVMVFPLFAAGLAAWVAHLSAEIPKHPNTQTPRLWHMHALLLILSLATVGSSSITQDWLVRDIDRLWLRMRDMSPLTKLSVAAERVRELAGTADVELLTQDPYLAVESGMTLPAGLVMGQFSYYPDMPDEDARRRNVLNRKMLRDLLRQSEAPVAAFSGYGLAVRSPQVTELLPEEQDELQTLLEERYEFVESFENFGQADTTLRIYKLK